MIETLVLAGADADSIWRQRVHDTLRVALPEAVQILLPAEAELDTLLPTTADPARPVAVVLLASPAVMQGPLLRMFLSRTQAMAGFSWLHLVETDWQASPLAEILALMDPKLPIAAMASSDWPDALVELSYRVAQLLGLELPAAESLSPPHSPPLPASTAGIGSLYGSVPGSFYDLSPPAASPPLRGRSPRLGAADPAGRVAGFRADAVKGNDQLDVRGEALTLAMVLAHKDVEPPISVGLFGDWGSGKSFFMAEMRRLIDRLATQSRAAGGRFCEHVVQLEFNAWHYMDSDLWASLAREIFEGLASAVADRENPQLDLERERLRAATRSTRDLIAATETQVADVQQRLAQTQQSLERVTQQQASVQDVARAAVTAVLETPEISQGLRQVAAELHIDDAQRSLDELQHEIQTMTTSARRARALATALGRHWKALGASLLVLGLGAWLLHQLLLRHGQDIAAWATALATAAGTLAALLATVGRGAHALLARVGNFQQSLDRQLAGQRAAREREIVERRAVLETERATLEAQRQQQQLELARLNRLSDELGKLAASRQLVDFIRQRDASTDYRKQLGTVARASQDFRRLSDLMVRAAAARRRQASGQADASDAIDAAMPQVDRIVLYIDDLDRCPENKVVDVLQAVHLLLAYPLFVVVVGVDPRWLLHSLEEHSGAFRRPAQPAEGQESGAWRSTALNYLEKIFQIPYTLRPMSADGFTRLVDDLSATRSDGQPPQRGRRPAAAAAMASTSGAVPSPSTGLSGSPRSRLPTASTSAPAPPPPAVAVAADELLDVNPLALELDARERLFMPRLHGLIPTPRATKRFVNVYRLVRASIGDEDSLRWFLDDREFSAVQLMLALVTGAPAEAAEILRALLARPVDAAWNLDWWALVDEVVQPRLAVPAWQRLQRQLAPLRDDPEIPQTCEGFRKWADDVARYSFFSGRVLLEPQFEAAGRPS